MSRLKVAARTSLDGLYLSSGLLAALCLIVILLLIVAQMIARWTGEIFPGAPSYAGYFMAAASFFALANSCALLGSMWALGNLREIARTRWGLLIASGVAMAFSGVYPRAE